MFELLTKTSPEWLSCVLENFDAFLLDHAACERKASGMAMSLVAHYPDKDELVRQMIDLAIEELTHFKEVMKWIQKSQLTMPPDEKDPYVNALRPHIRKESEAYMLDRLLMASIIEARGHERFQMVANGLDTGDLQKFYQAIAHSEKRHFLQFIELAKHYFPDSTVAERLDVLLPIEANIIDELHIRPALH